MPHEQPEHSALRAFAGLATAYCALVEGHATVGVSTFLTRTHRALVLLYAAALELPDKDALVIDDAEPAHASATAGHVPVDNDTRDALARAIATRLGDADIHLELPEGADSAQVAIPVSLSRGLVIIHQDLRAGLYTYETDGAAYGLWHFRTFFEASWNGHLGSALRALEAMARRNGEWPRGGS
jgi:hypothetical protein